MATKDMLMTGAMSTAHTPELQCADAQIKVEHELFIGKTGSISGSGSLILEAEEVLNNGKLKLDSTLKATGTQFKNHGSMNAVALQLGYDTAVVNWGTMSAPNMVIHSNFFNLFGRVYATESLTCAGFIGANIGLIAANNYSNSNLLSTNLGLTIPNFSADWRYIISDRALLSAARTAVTMMLPGYANTINMAFMLGSSVYHAVKNKDQLSWNTLKTMRRNLKKMRRHEWAPIACRVINFATLGYNAVSSCGKNSW